MDNMLWVAMILALTSGFGASAKNESLACRAEGLFANHTSGCREYYRCKNGLVAGTYSCPEGLAFNEAARQCLPQNKASCVRHICDPSDGSFYTSPGTQCQYYYKCEEGTPLELACPSGSWFDFKKQECIRSAGVCYEPVCTGHTNGRYPDSTQACHRSLVCYGGELVSVESPGPLSERMCPSPRATAVAFPISSSDRCASLEDGSYPAPGARCRDYFVCKDGSTQASMRCPERYLFDGVRCVVESSTTACMDECSNLDDGFHADLASGCREYFYCQNRSSLFRTTCTDGTVFDGQMCVSTAFFKCPAKLRENPCLNRPDGYMRDYKDCSSYIYCVNEEVKFRDSCQEGLVWNGDACVTRGEFRCAGPYVSPVCTEKASGYHQDKTRGSDCRNYYHCHSGSRIDFTCPIGRIFNGEECVRQELYTCPSLERDSCEFKPDGYYQQTNGDCRAYYLCSGGNKIIYLCDRHQAFDGEKCVDKRSYKCPYHSDDCTGKSNGYHQDPNANCRKYYFCDEGEKLTTLQCSGSKLFNGRGCVNPKEYQCPAPRTSTNACKSRSDGYYGREGTKCRQFVKCSGYREVEQKTCPAGKVFNGVDSCVDKNCSLPAVTCEMDGFFLDLASGCKSYHVCIDRRKSTLYCDGSKLFNGQLCVPESEFQCPEECSQHYCHNDV